MDNKTLKRQHEKVVAEVLVRELDVEDFHFDCLGNDAGEPDVIFKHGNKRIGVEVAVAYLDNDCAKFEWDYARGNRNDFGASSPLQVNPSEKLYAFLQGVINRKCETSFKYSGVDAVWLCVEERNPLSNSSSIKKCIKNVQLPENKFDHIYLLHQSPLHEGGDYKVFTLK